MGHTSKTITQPDSTVHKNCLVTGGAGFIGTNLIDKLLAEGHNVVSVDNYSTGKHANEINGCNYLLYDIRNSEFYNGLADIVSFKPDIIFHMAALPRIQPSFKNPVEVTEVNVLGTLNVLEYARMHNIPVIYAGSSSFHSGKFKNPYTFSKWQGEELCKMYKAIYDVQLSICRFYNVYGNYMINEGNYRTVLSVFLEQHQTNKSLTITGDGEQRRDFTHVEDIVNALVNCMYEKVYGHVFELGRGKNYSINEIAEMFGGEKVYISRPKGEAQDTLCTAKEARHFLKWEPKINVGEWINDICNNRD